MISRPRPRGLAERINGWSEAQTWLAIAAGALVLIVLDRLVPGVVLAPLYVPLIATAAWRIGFISSCLVAAAAVGVNAYLCSHLPIGFVETPAILAMRAIVRLATFAFIIAIVTSFRRAYDREQFMARRDPMTGAANKLTFERHADKLLEAAIAVDRTLLLATIEVDNFKTINDTHGHAAGDAVLRAFAAGAEAVIRKQDCLGRIGGDEFAFLIPVESVDEGCTTAGTLHARLSSMLRELPHATTISMGALVIHPEAGLERAALMNRVDQLMYAVKRAGKGAVMVDTIGVPQPVSSEDRRALRIVRSTAA